MQNLIMGHGTGAADVDDEVAVELSDTSDDDAM